MKSVLITGAAGYVGGEAVRQFQAKGYDVTALDLFKPDADIPWINVDFTDIAALDKSMEGRKFDYIVHIASRPPIRAIPTRC